MIDNRNPEDIHNPQLISAGAEIDVEDMLELMRASACFVDEIIARPGMPEYLLKDARFLREALGLYQDTVNLH